MLLGAAMAANDAYSLLNNKCFILCLREAAMDSGFVMRKVEYVYRHRGRYMVFQNVPAEVCLRCGTRYFAADVILAIERRFFEIYDEKQEPKRTISVPIEVFA